MIKSLLSTALLALIFVLKAQAQSKVRAEVSNEMVARATAVDFCDVERHPEKFDKQMIRVRVTYLTNMEQAAITSPLCESPIPDTWVTFDDQWESRSPKSGRGELAKLKWRNPLDIVFVGIFRSEGHFGHMDMYPHLLKVYKVEVVRKSGNSQPMHGAL